MISITRLLWDEHNIAHIARHIVTPQEVEAACYGNPAVLSARNGRLALIGRSGPRILTVILNPQMYEGEYYVVTARDADKNERDWYRTYKEGTFL